VLGGQNKSSRLPTKKKIGFSVKAKKWGIREKSYKNRAGMGEGCSWLWGLQEDIGDFVGTRFGQGHKETNGGDPGFVQENLKRERQEKEQKVRYIMFFYVLRG